MTSQRCFVEDSFRDTHYLSRIAHRQPTPRVLISADKNSRRMFTRTLLKKTELLSLEHEHPFGVRPCSFQAAESKFRRTETLGRKPTSVPVGFSTLRGIGQSILPASVPLVGSAVDRMSCSDLSSGVTDVLWKERFVLVKASKHNQHKTLRSSSPSNSNFSSRASVSNARRTERCGAGQRNVSRKAAVLFCMKIDFVARKESRTYCSH